MEQLRALASRGRSFRAKGQYERSIRGEEEVLIQATLLHIDGNEIAIELEVPPDGVVLPQGEVEVMADSRIAKATIAIEKSTHAGPHQAGTVVRLTLRIEAGAKWPDKGTVILRWALPGSAGDDAQRFMVEVAMDAARDVRPHG